MRAGALIVLIVILCFPSSASGNPRIGIFADPANYWTPFIEEMPPTYTLYVIVSNTFGLTAVQFAAPLPDCMANATLISETAYPNLMIGSIETGVMVAFGLCRQAPIEVMRLTFLSTGIDTCCYWGIVPDPAVTSGEIEGVDCNDSKVFMIGMTTAIHPEGLQGCGAPTVPSNPLPPDGAIDQPLDVTLDWDSEPTIGTGLGVFFGVVYLGTEMEPPLYTTMVDPPYNVGPLDPATTYYWRINSVVSDYGSTLGPVWQFTTRTDPSPVRFSTWGAIKPSTGSNLV